MAAPRRRPSSGPLAVLPILRVSQKVIPSGIAKTVLFAAAAGSVSANSCFLGRRLANGRDGARRCAERARQRPRTHPKRGPSPFVYPGAKSFFGYSRRLPAPIRPTGPSLEPQITIGSIARRVGRNGAGSRRVRTPHFLGFAICIKLFSLFSLFTAAAGSIPAKRPFVGTTFSNRLHSTKSWAKRSRQRPQTAPPPEFYTNYRRNCVFHAVLCFAVLCGQCLSPLYRNTLTADRRHHTGGGGGGGFEIP